MRTRFLQVLLCDEVIGYLGEIDSVTRFVPLNAYVDDPQRQTLSMAYGFPDDDPNVRTTLSNVYNQENFGLGRLPNFFSNLLPEGALRDRLARQRATTVNAEFDLLSAAGNNLPGGIAVRPAPDIPPEIRTRLITTDNDNVEVTQVDDPIDGASSLSGVQEKLALSMLRNGERFSIEGRVDGAPVIAKFAPLEHPDMLENELVCTQLAQLVGIRTIQPEFYPIDRLDIDALKSVAHAGTRFLASPRFDRAAHGQRVHVEDWCQVTSQTPGAKYALTEAFPKAAAALFASAVDGVGEMEELLRRIVANALLGNCDAHLKNFMCSYDDRRHPSLSPAYDLVCTYPYAIEKDLKANLAMDAKQRNFRLSDYTRFAAQIGFSTRLAEHTVRKTVSDALALWPARLALPDTPSIVRATIEERFRTMALIQDVAEKPRRVGGLKT